jgi:predicted pyridoxine 5'-phosphate oxidase superfamily flavin-nucleotide-binding protein
MGADATIREQRLMTRAFTAFAFSPSVKAAQARHGVREHGARLEQKEPANDRLTPDLMRYVAETDSFFIATASREGWPHVQHRGGPAGFLRVIDDRTLAFADYAGNRQLITVGNLAENDRVMLFIIDYERGRRLKIWGRARIIDEDPALFERASDPGYPAKVERVIRIDVKAFDLNCRQHFPKLVRVKS